MSIYVMDPHEPAKACVIWLHGLGADASDMQGIVEAFPETSVPCKHIFIDAPLRPVTINNGITMHAWYDITGFTISDREDRQGIEASEKLIRNVMDNLFTQGFEANQIFLAGFSQGGAMALYTGIHAPYRLAGVIALSGYLPLSTECTPQLDKNTPFFIAGGTADPVVLPAWTQLSRDWVLNAGYESVSFHEYPIEHSICYEEIQDISRWINLQIEGETR